MTSYIGRDRLWNHEPPRDAHSAVTDDAFDNTMERFWRTRQTSNRPAREFHADAPLAWTERPEDLEVAMREFENAMGGPSREVRGSTVAPIRARVDPSGFGRSTDRGSLADLPSVADDVTKNVRVVLGQSKAHHDRSAVHPSFTGQESPSSKLEGSVWRLRQAQADLLREAGQQRSRLAAKEEEVASLRSEEQELKREVSVRQQEVGATLREVERLSIAQMRVPAAQASEPEWRWVPTRLESKLAELSELRGGLVSSFIAHSLSPPGCFAHGLSAPGSFAHVSLSSGLLRPWSLLVVASPMIPRCFAHGLSSWLLRPRSLSSCLGPESLSSLLRPLVSLFVPSPMVSLSSWLLRTRKQTS